MVAAGTVAAPALAQAQNDLTPYVRARAADADGAAEIAAKGYATALAQLPGDKIVAIRAYRQGLAVGDYALVGQAASTLVKAGAAPPDVAIVQYALALKAGDTAAARTALAQIARGPFDFMAPVLRAWMAFDAGGDGASMLDATRGNSLARRYAAEHGALLLIAEKKPEEAMRALRLMIGGGRDSEDLRIDAALLLANLGDRRDADILLSGARSQSALRDALGRGRKPNAQFGAARMFVSLTSQLVDEDMTALSVALSRSALLLDPTDDRARLFLAEALSRSGSDSIALETLAQVRPDSAFARGAEAGAIAALRRAGRGDEAIARARVLAEDREANSADARTYGDLLAAAERYDDAAAAYGKAIARERGGDDWTLLYLRGMALDRAGRWKEALPSLRRAAELAPSQPEVLDYLATAQVRRGVNIDDAQAMLERARAIKPDDAQIADSLAWTYLQRGDPARALPMLERAVQDDPGGTLVNEHLGDAYWALGRRYEARYAWKAAAIYAERPANARIQAKIANGLTAAN